MKEKYSSLKEKAYQVIKARIISGEYEPGQVLNERAIIDELSISRTPFREAINALSKENLVDIYPNRGMFVKAISIEDVSDVFDIRQLLEPYMIRTVCDRIPSDVVKELEERNARADLTDVDAVLVEDDYFHQTILQYAKNKHLVRIMRNLYDCNRVRILLKKKNLSVKEIVAEHGNILEAIKKEDRDLAAEVMEAHIIESKNRALKSLL